MNIQKDRNYYIDFLRFVFSLMIVSYHSWVFTGVFGAGYFNRGYFAVDFYFIVTGFLFIKSVEKISEKKTKENIGKLDLKFVWSRLKPLLPSIIVITILGYILVYYRNILDYHILFSDSTISELFFLGFLGNGMGINLGCWYISVMLVLFFLLFPLVYKYKKTYIYYIAPAIILFTYGLVRYQHINITDPLVSNFIFIDGFYKGLIFMNIGVLAYAFSNYLKKKEWTRKQKIIITVLETLMYLFLVANMHYGIAGSYLIAIIFFFSISITFSNQSYTSKIFTSPKFQSLGKFGFLMYLANVPVRTFVQNNIHLSYHHTLMVYWGMTISLAILTYIIAEIIWPKLKIKRKLKKELEKKKEKVRKRG